MNDTFTLVRPTAGQPTPLEPGLLTAREVPVGLHDLRESARDFVLGEDLAEAVNVALAVGAPLLLTGEPGTGKTQLAYHLAWYFGIETGAPATWRQPFTFHVKSTSRARDLLYTFDTVAYFHDAQTPGKKLDKERYVQREALWRAIEAVNANRAAIVLIDEIDKAPRDFPNDLLRELDQYSFKIRELDREIRREEKTPPPVVIITSNSENRLPPAFLRRCIVHEIEFSEQILIDAVARRRERGQLNRLDDGTLTAARERVIELRDHHNLEKKPSTAEFLAWLGVLELSGTSAREIKGVAVSKTPFLGMLVKDREDRTRLA